MDCRTTGVYGFKRVWGWLSGYCGVYGSKRLREGGGTVLCGVIPFFLVFDRSLCTISVTIGRVI